MSHAISSASPVPVEALTPIEVLVIARSAAEALTTLTEFRSSGLTNGKHCIRQGEDALLYLRRQGPYAGARIPDFIYLDLLQPKMSGLRALKVIKSTPALTHIPIVVAADSEDARFVQAVCSLSGSGFIRKPTALSEFLDSIAPCYEYWISVVTLNRKAHAGGNQSAVA